MLKANIQIGNNVCFTSAVSLSPSPPSFNIYVNVSKKSYSLIYLGSGLFYPDKCFRTSIPPNTIIPPSNIFKDFIFL